MKPPPKPPIALIGLMGSGKSSVARVLGERLGASVADLDAMIEAVEGRSVAEVFERAGEAWFRGRERDLLASVVDTGVRVIACGGGIVVDAACRGILRERCRTVWLEVTPAEAAQRIERSGAGATRPLLAGAEPQARLAALLAERAPLYAECAASRVATDGLDPAAVAERVLRDLGEGA